MGKAEARALAQNYMSRIVDPVINPAICYVHVCVAINRLELGPIRSTDHTDHDTHKFACLAGAHAKAKARPVLRVYTRLFEELAGRRPPRAGPVVPKEAERRDPRRPEPNHR